MNRKSVQFICLVFGFIVATIIGTLTHEGGHYLMAKLLGYDAEINYGATFLTNPEMVNSYHSFLITIAGPIETILTGTIGLILLFIGRKTFCQKEHLNIPQWGLIFISLFWLRQLANFLIWFGSYILVGEFSDRPDEVKISRYFNLPDWLVLFATALISAATLITVVFVFIPNKIRSTFILSGLIGGTSGYILWLKLLGPILMP